MIKTIIVDDEQQARSALKHEIKLNCPNLQIIGEASDVQEGVDIITQLKPDLVFLDIQLTSGVGFNILEQVRDLNFKVIFTTAYSQYALKAFKFNAIHYLLKPIDADELVEAVSRVDKTDSGTMVDVIMNLIKNQTLNDPFKKIALQTSDGITLYELNKIIRCNSEGNYTKFHFTDSKSLLIAKTLKEFEELLSPFGFERVHVSHMINLHHLVSYQTKEGGFVTMSDKSSVPVSHRKKTHLLNVLKQLNEPGG